MIENYRIEPLRSDALGSGDDGALLHVRVMYRPDRIIRDCVGCADYWYGQCRMPRPDGFEPEAIPFVIVLRVALYSFRERMYYEARLARPGDYDHPPPVLDGPGGDELVERLDIERFRDALIRRGMEREIRRGDETTRMMVERVCQELIAWIDHALMRCAIFEELGTGVMTHHSDEDVTWADWRDKDERRLAVHFRNAGPVVILPEHLAPWKKWLSEMYFPVTLIFRFENYEPSEGGFFHIKYIETIGAAPHPHLSTSSGICLDADLKTALHGCFRQGMDAPGIVGILRYGLGCFHLKDAYPNFYRYFNLDICENCGDPVFISDGCIDCGEPCALCGIPHRDSSSCQVCWRYICPYCMTEANTCHECYQNANAHEG